MFHKADDAAEAEPPTKKQKLPADANAAGASEAEQEVIDVEEASEPDQDLLSPHLGHYVRTHVRTYVRKWRIFLCNPKPNGPYVRTYVGLHL